MTEFGDAFKNLTEKLSGWLEAIILLLPNIALALVVMGVGYALTKYVRRWIAGIVRRFSNNHAVNNLITSVLTALFIIGLLMISLSILNLSKVVTTILAGAGVAGLAIGLALQNPIMNLFSGVMLSTRGSVRIGDLVETNSYFGTVKEITLRSTILVTPQGEEVLIPNKEIYHNPLKNYSSSGKRRVDLSCGISYGDDLNKVRTVALDAIQNGVKYDNSKKVELFYEAFGDSSINFQLRFWLEAPDLKTYLSARSEAIMALKNAFDEHDIMIPFPIRTLDFGIKGGEKLSAMINTEKLSKRS